MEKFKKIANSILTVIIFTVLPVVVFTLITSKTDLFGVKSYVVLTGSMEPTIPVGSIIYTLKTPEYKSGDVVAFESGGVTVTHRINGVKNEAGQNVSLLVSPLEGLKKNEPIFYQTKGDANKKEDSKLVPQKNVSGQVLTYLPFSGKLIFFLKTIPGFLLLIILPTLIFIGVELWNIKKEIVKQTEKKLLEKMNLT